MFAYFLIGLTFAFIMFCIGYTFDDEDDDSSLGLAFMALTALWPAFALFLFGKLVGFVIRKLHGK